MDDTGEIRDDIRIPEGDLGKDIAEKAKDDNNQFLVTVLSAIGEEAAIAIKNMPKWPLGVYLVNEWSFPFLLIC